VLTHPRVGVTLVALVLVIVPLRYLQHRATGVAESAQQVAATTPVPSSSYHAFSSHFAFISKGARQWGGHPYAYSAWTTPWVTPAHPFTQLIPSWNATTPAGSWIQVLVQVRDGAGALSAAKDLGRWSAGDAVIKRSSAGKQADPVARVSTDTLIAIGRALASYRITVRLMQQPGGKAPTLHTIGAVASQSPSARPTSVPLNKTAVSLALPAYSQMTHRGQAPQYGGGGEAWCSPTSLSMVLGYYGRLPAPASYSWVPSSYADRWVDHVARLTFDYAYQGTGNWPFNTAYAATRTGSAFVTRLTDLRMAERFIRVGIPLVLSIQFDRGQLQGAPISATPGHLVVLAGFTAAGNPIVNDPAAASNSTVRRTYDRAEFERAWLRSGGTAYVVTDPKHPLPTRPNDITSW
jgi:hypothetical protein